MAWTDLRTTVWGKKGDLLSSISPLDQQKIMAEKTIDWLSQHGN